MTETVTRADSTVREFSHATSGSHRRQKRREAATPEILQIDTGSSSGVAIMLSISPPSGYVIQESEGSSTAGQSWEWVERSEPISQTVTEPTTSDLLAKIHAESGLTWEQLAKLIGVSRRSVHFWSKGGRVNAVNHEKLNRLNRCIAALRSNSPEGRRQELFAIRGDGGSLFAELKASNEFSSVRLELPGKTAAEFLGAAE